MKLVNCTEHDIVLQLPDGSQLTLPPSGHVCRVEETPGTPEDAMDGVPVPVYGPAQVGALQGLPAPQEGVLYVVSAKAADHVPAARRDVLRPGTGPDDKPVRKDGRIAAVTRLIRVVGHK